MTPPRSLAACVLLLVTTHLLSAADYSWSNASGGNWNTSTNWSLNAVPDGSDNATLGALSGTYTVILDSDQAINNFTIDTADATLEHSYSTLSLGGTMTLTAGNYILGNGANLVGGTIASGGTGKLVAAGGILDNVAVGANVLDFSQDYASVTFRGTTAVAPGTTLNLAGFGAGINFDQTTTLNNLTFAATGGSNYLQIYDTHTVTLGNTSAINVAADKQLSIYLAGNLANQSTIALTNPNSRLDLYDYGGSFSNHGTLIVGQGAYVYGDVPTSGGVVRGTGTLTGEISFSGTGNELEVGPGIGALTIGDLILNENTTVRIDLSGTEAGVSHDQLIVTGNADLNNAILDINFGYAPQDTDRLFILVNDGASPITGHFAGMTQGEYGEVNDIRFWISYTGDASFGSLTGGNDIVLYNFVPVPEPSTVLITAGLALLVGRRLRRVAISRIPQLKV